MFVDLDFIKKNILQRIQRRIPRSEIVHGNADIPIVEEADRLLVIGGNLFPHHGRILPGDIDNADKDIGAVSYTHLDAGAKQPTTINMMYDFKGLDYHKFADIVDFVSWDNYPTWHKEAEAVTAADTAMQHDIMRSIQKKPFYLMESCPSATNWQPVSKLKKPGMLHAASIQAVAHGSDSVLYLSLIHI